MSMTNHLFSDGGSSGLTAVISDTTASLTSSFTYHSLSGCKDAKHPTYALSSLHNVNATEVGLYFENAASKGMVIALVKQVNPSQLCKAF